MRASKGTRPDQEPAATPKPARRKRAAPPPPRWSERLYVRLAREDLALFKFLLEGYDNLAYLSVLDKTAALAEIVFSPDQAEEVAAFLEGAKQEVEFAVIEAGRLRGQTEGAFPPPVDEKRPDLDTGTLMS